MSRWNPTSALQVSLGQRAQGRKERAEVGGWTWLASLARIMGVQNYLRFIGQLERRKEPVKGAEREKRQRDGPQSHRRFANHDSTVAK
jgi:hypothetical protein